MSNLAALAATSFRSPHELRGTPDLETAAREFESYLLGELLRLSEASSLYEGPFDGGDAGRMMKSLFHEEVARLVSQSGGLGIGRMMTEELGGAASGDAPVPDETDDGEGLR